MLSVSSEGADILGCVTSHCLTNLLSVQAGANANFAAPRVNSELAQRVTAHDGVTQQVVVGRTVTIAGRHLQGEREKNQGHKTRAGVVKQSNNP